MLRAILANLVRLLVWFFAFYIVMHVVRAVIRLFSPPSPARKVRGEEGEQDRAVAGKTTGPSIEYHDVKDAKFSDLSDTHSEKPSA